MSATPICRAKSAALSNGETVATGHFANSARAAVGSVHSSPRAIPLSSGRPLPLKVFDKNSTRAPSRLSDKDGETLTAKKQQENVYSKWIL
jgi:hypothetical protein